MGCRAVQAEYVHVYNPLNITTCAICYEPCNDPPLACSHSFHQTCLRAWVNKCKEKKRKPTCPMCRRTI